MIRFVFSTVILLGITMLVGCGKEATSTKGKTSEAKGNANETAHSGWWCDEHGIKESECSMCSPKVAKAFQDKKDWCDMHLRAKSQCFICDPSLREKFAVQYRAKFGKEPPEPTENMPEKAEKKS